MFGQNFYLEIRQLKVGLGLFSYVNQLAYLHYVDTQMHSVLHITYFINVQLVRRTTE